MTAVSRPEHDATLRAVVARLVEAVDPEKLILFGSRAKGCGGPDSDYNILSGPNPAAGRTGPLCRTLWGISRPVDLIWFTPQEIEEWSQVRPHIVTQAVRSGVVVYEKGG